MKENCKYIKLGDLNSNFEEQIDYFFISASYDERSTKIAEKIKNLNPLETVICCNTNNNYNKTSLNTLQSYFEGKHEIIDLSQDNPSKNNNALLIKLKSISEKQPLTRKIVIDITSFTHETLLILYRLIQKILPLAINVEYVYLEANDYSWNIENPEEKWLSKGISEIRSVIGYPGIINPSKDTHLIIQVGFEVERTIKLIEKYEAKFISLGLGITEVENPNNKAILEIAQRKHKLLTQQFLDVNVFEFCLDSPYQTKSALEEQVKKFPSTNIIIAPMNNKISTIGVGMLAMEDYNIQLCYAKAMNYNTQYYSKPSDNCCLF